MLNSRAAASVEHLRDVEIAVESLTTDTIRELSDDEISLVFGGAEVNS